ncbi:uncharacterized protein LOC141913061 [Tubulanus polymorphus]|uniref:uncharacterized protein LOC141913061 n=1 Tax=Tubulanus polymorphus TaxID=672921 RepID=UPI003DA5F356
MSQDTTECTRKNGHSHVTPTNSDDAIWWTQSNRRKRMKPSLVIDPAIDESSRDSNLKKPDEKDSSFKNSSNNSSSVENDQEVAGNDEDDAASATVADSDEVANKICDICCFESSDAEKFMTHVNFHLVALKCWYCHAVFAAGEFLKKHVDQCVNRGRIRDCSYCGESFTDRDSLLSHEFYVHHMTLGGSASGGGTSSNGKKLNRAEQLFRCPVCFEKASTFAGYQDHLDGHLKSGVDESALECKLCRVTFANEMSLRNHVATSRHREVALRVKNLFRCHHCNTIYVNRDSYAMHMLEIAREESHNALAQMGIHTGSGIVKQSALLLLQQQQQQQRGEKTICEDNEVDGCSKRPELVVIKKEKIDEDSDDDGKNSTNNDITTDVAASDEESKFDPHTPLLNINESMKAVNLTLSESQKRRVDYPYECGVCKRRLVDQDMFAMHMLQHARQTNEVAATDSVSVAAVLNPPSTTSHPVIKSEPVDAYEIPRSTASNLYSIACTFCSLKFPSRDGLAMHVMLDHATNASSIAGAYSRRNVSASATSATATNYTTLENLINSLYHDNNNASPMTTIGGANLQNRIDTDIYQCPVCKIGLKDQDALAMHMLLHSHLPINTGGGGNYGDATSRNIASSSSASSPSTSSTSMHDWQRSILLALYKDQSNFVGRNSSPCDRELADELAEQTASRHRSLAVDSEVTTSSDARKSISDSGELFDGNIIVYDKNTETWACTVCKVEFRTLLYVTRHLGHVSHKLQVEKRLRLEMCSSSTNSTDEKTAELPRSNRVSYATSLLRPLGDSFTRPRSSHDSTPHVFNCYKCCAVFPSKISYYNHFSNNEHCRPATETSAPASSTDAERRSPSKRPRMSYASTHSSYGRHTDRRRCSTQSAPCTSESEPRIDIPSPMSVRSYGRTSRDNSSSTSSFLSPNSIRRSIDASSNNIVASDESKSRNSSCVPAPSLAQSDCTTDVLDFVLKQPILLMCKFCQMIFCDRTLYYLHMGLHNLNNPWQCNLCGKVCDGVHEFSSHVIHYN